MKAKFQIYHTNGWREIQNFMAHLPDAHPKSILFHGSLLLRTQVKGVCMWFYFDDFLFIFSGRYVERIKTDQFLLSRPNQLMGCLINKVASSSMMRMYLTLQGLDNKKIESPHGYRLKFVPEVSQ